MMQALRCHVFRGLPKELEEEVTKFLEVTLCRVYHVVQSESQNHVTLTMIYELVPPELP